MRQLTWHIPENSIPLCNDNNFGIPLSAMMTSVTYPGTTESSYELRDMSICLLDLSFLILLLFHSIRSIQYNPTHEPMTPCFLSICPSANQKVPFQIKLQHVSSASDFWHLFRGSEEIPTQTARCSSSRSTSLWEHGSYRSHASHWHLLSLSSFLTSLLTRLPFLYPLHSALLYCLLSGPLSQITPKHCWVRFDLYLAVCNFNILSHTNAWSLYIYDADTLLRLLSPSCSPQLPRISLSW